MGCAGIWGCDMERIGPGEVTNFWTMKQDGLAFPSHKKGWQDEKNGMLGGV